MDQKTAVSFSEFKGKPIMVINMGQSQDGTRQFDFTFGKAKAKAIVDNFEAIKKFAESV